MTLEVNEKIELSNLRFKKAQQFLADAQANLIEGRHHTAINRSYYAALTTVRSLLILEGVNPETHDGAITMLSLKFIKTNLLHIKIVKDFKALYNLRTDSDYGDFDSLSLEEANDSFQKAETLLNEINIVREKLISEM